MKSIKTDIHGTEIKEGHTVIYATGGLQSPRKVIRIHDHPDNTPDHPQGELHLEGIKPLLWINYPLEILNSKNNAHQTETN